MFFYGHKERPDGLHVFSQWCPVTFRAPVPCMGDDGKTVQTLELTFVCAEQYMMYRKAALFGDWKMAQAIMNTRDPKRHKELGRQVRGFDSARWDREADALVEQGNWYKFDPHQNPALAHFLKSTYPRMLVEASPSDRIWGIGLSAAQAARIPPDKWPGQNKLGKALMAVRKNLMALEASTQS